MSDDDLIRRGDALDAMCKGPRTVQERIDEIRALPAAQPAPVTVEAWQPIETAPKDGTHILVWFNHDADPYYDGDKLTDYATWAESGDFLSGEGHAIARWFPQHWESVDEYGGGYYLPAWWFALENDDFERPVNATHWMPLPAPPALAGDKP